MAVVLALLGLGASAAQAVADTFKVVFQANDNVLAGLPSSGSSFSTTLGMTAGTSPSIAIPPPAPAPATGCGAVNNCTPRTFADAVLSYPGINGVITASNEYALETWERAQIQGSQVKEFS